MKYSINYEILSVHFNFVFKSADFHVDVIGGPVDVALFEKMMDELGFDKMTTVLVNKEVNYDS